ncbi:unnamed protein product [Moneuplotes crassus]|uniref:Uncharacterized protein n=1 Tax=Euplotes crassus TaxID=5936 RepID=A0AAD1XVH6_EUPCR|nr:unnamed protein product [Moneuplotes crassus]
MESSTHTDTSNPFISEEKPKPQVNYSAYLNPQRRSSGLTSKPYPQPKNLDIDEDIDEFRREEMESRDDIDDFKKLGSLYSTHMGQGDTLTPQVPAKCSHNYIDEEVESHCTKNVRVNLETNKLNKGDFTSKATSGQEIKVNQLETVLNEKIQEKEKKENELKELSKLIQQLEQKMKDKTLENREIREKINYLLQL